MIYLIHENSELIGVVKATPPPGRLANNINENELVFQQDYDSAYNSLKANDWINTPGDLFKIMVENMGWTIDFLDYEDIYDPD